MPFNVRSQLFQFSIGIMLLGAGTVVITGWVLHEASLVVPERTGELRALAARQEIVREDERMRIAREIDDELGAVLTGIGAYLSYAEHHAERAGAPVDTLLRDAGRLADDAIDTVRRVSADLRPSVLDHLDLWAEVEWHASQVEARCGLRCPAAIDTACLDIGLAPGHAMAVFRIVQEALTNVMRHAGATAVSVQARRAGGAIEIEVADLSPHDAWGVAGMHERAVQIGAWLTVRAAERGGTVLRLVLRADTESLA